MIIIKRQSNFWTIFFIILVVVLLLYLAFGGYISRAIDASDKRKLINENINIIYQYLDEIGEEINYLKNIQDKDIKNRIQIIDDLIYSIKDEQLKYMKETLDELYEYTP